MSCWILLNLCFLTLVQSISNRSDYSWFDNVTSTTFATSTNGTAFDVDIATTKWNLNIGSTSNDYFWLTSSTTKTNNKNKKDPEFPFLSIDPVLLPTAFENNCFRWYWFFILCIPSALFQCCLTLCINYNWELQDDCDFREKYQNSNLWNRAALDTLLIRSILPFVSIKNTETLKAQIYNVSGMPLLHTNKQNENILVITPGQGNISAYQL